MKHSTENSANYTVAIYPKGNGTDYEWDNLDITQEELNDFLKRHNGTQRLVNRIMFIPKSGRNIRIFPKNIMYADTCKNCTTLYLTNGEELTGICTLSELHRHLSGKGFLRIHKSYLINSKFITSFYGNMIFLENGKEFLIGRDFRSEVKAHFDVIGSKSRLFMQEEKLSGKEKKTEKNADDS
jgi:DNA-binding LytR/AlgR family response regulator